MLDAVFVFLKGIAIGAANVIPGVSGGTIALITGVFERLINAIKSFDISAIRLLFQFQLKKFSQKVDLYFLILIFFGAALSILTLARVLDFWFTTYPYYIWALFFGLILASVFFVIKRIDDWTGPVFISLIGGLSVSILISIMSPLSENSSFFYLFLCGIIAICSMILPGLSGSFILVLMGNYQLIAIDAINSLNMAVIIPVALGAIFGLIVFSHLLSFIFKKYKNMTIASLSGFILGSLLILWPWKNELYKLNIAGQFVLKKGGEKILEGYSWYLPSINTETFVALCLMLVGAFLIYMIERVSTQAI